VQVRASVRVGLSGCWRQVFARSSPNFLPSLPGPETQCPQRWRAPGSFAGESPAIADGIVRKRSNPHTRRSRSVSSSQPRSSLGPHHRHASRQRRRAAATWGEVLEPGQASKHPGHGRTWRDSSSALSRKIPARAETTSPIPSRPITSRSVGSPLVDSQSQILIVVTGHGHYDLPVVDARHRTTMGLAVSVRSP
jgi:hypothetical protein